MTHNDDNCIFVIYTTNCITDKNFSPLCLAIQETLSLKHGRYHILAKQCRGVGSRKIQYFGKYKEFCIEILDFSI